MIAWFFTCGSVVLLIIFFALWRRERALRLDAEQRERWWADIADRAMEDPEDALNIELIEAGPYGKAFNVTDWGSYAGIYSGKKIVN